MSDWAKYYAAAGDDPRETLVQAADAFAAPSFAVDLGCGTGRDTLELLRRGWRVLAIDGEREAVDRLRERVGDDPRLETQVARYEEARWPECDLVNASFALPFSAPPAFAQVWERIVRSLRSGGRFAGQLFGDRDGWAPADDITFVRRADAEAMFSTFELERFDEVEEDSQTAVGDPKHWHVYHVVARKL
jgi:SAM-dependent methyltransferase